jgi:hypothetical protein
MGRSRYFDDKKSASMSRLRINGLVKIMNQVREGLSEGIPAGKEDDFRAMVRGTLKQVEEICRAHKTPPQKLPAPTYRAYRFLKELDLRDLPVRQEPVPPPPPRIRVRNLIAACKAIQVEITEISRKKENFHKRPTRQDSQISTLLTQIRTSTKMVEQMMIKAGVGPDALSNRSRRAYHWLQYLDQADNLERHLATLQMAQAEIEALEKQPKLRSRWKYLPVRFELYNLAAVYRVCLQPDFLLIEAQEAFTGVPSEVIQALVRTALLGKQARLGKGRTYLSIVKEYTQTKTFQGILSKLESEKVQIVDRSHGQHFDLQQIFERVNQAHFSGQMEKPNLIWNKTLTHRKFGHYQATNDTVMVSMSLDEASTPVYVIEFIMYHELLHKHLGVLNQGGRSYAHTKTFREAEVRFPYQKQAQAYLNELSTKMSRGKSWKPKK